MAHTGVRVPSATALCPQAVADVAGELQGLRLRMLSVGGLPGDGGTVEQGFRGCLQVRAWGHGHGVAKEQGDTAQGCGHGGGDRCGHRAWGHDIGCGDMDQWWGTWARAQGHGHRAWRHGTYRHRAVGQVGTGVVAKGQQSMGLGT